MDDEREFRHLGGGRKGLFLCLRYVYIIAAAYLLIFHAPQGEIGPATALMIAAAMASNVALSFVPGQYVFAWYVEAPVLVADTIWVSWALNTTGGAGQELFLLYFFVLFLSALGENLVVVLLASTLVSAAYVYFGTHGNLWAGPQLLRVAFFYTVALFYGHVLSQIRRERQRADRGFAWARELEAKVAERTAELRRLYEESVTASRLKSELVANMSHELRTPIHIILGYSDIMLDAGGSDRSPEDVRMIERIRHAARGLLQLVESVLDLGRLEAGRMPVARQSVALDRFVADLRDRERAPLAPDAVLEWRVAPELPMIETDVAKLTVVLDNLVNNAIKFTTAGTITITVEDHPDLWQVEFRIDDTGEGIPPEQLTTVFEPFRQLDGAGERGFGGVGLGLAIVQRYVALLGGEIHVRSVVGRGTTFVVTLPYRPHLHAAPVTAPRAARRATVTPGSASAA